MPFGSEVALTPGLSPAEKMYIRLFGVPILGLRIRARTIIPFFEEVDGPRRIVDAGSGRGMMTFAAARRFPGAEVIGVDLNDEQNRANNEIAGIIGFKNVRFETRDAMRLPEMGLFDLIISCDSLEHLEDDLAGVRMFHEALNPGGHFLVHVPNLTRNLFGWHRPNWMDVEGHVRPGYSRAGIIALLTEGGFSVRKSAFNYNSLETLANDISKLITGAREANRGLYALVFPFLMAIAWAGSLYRPKGDGSGLIALARRGD